MELAHAEHFDVEVVYNGVRKPFRVQLGELIKTLLDQAIQAFGIGQNTHLLGLFTPENRELSDGETIRQAGAHPRERLNLRPSAVRGG